MLLLLLLLLLPSSAAAAAAGGHDHGADDEDKDDEEVDWVAQVAHAGARASTSCVSVFERSFPPQMFRPSLPPNARTITRYPSDLACSMVFLWHGSFQPACLLTTVGDWSGSFWTPTIYATSIPCFDSRRL